MTNYKFKCKTVTEAMESISLVMPVVSAWRDSFPDYKEHIEIEDLNDENEEHPILVTITIKKAEDV